MKLSNLAVEQIADYKRMLERELNDVWVQMYNDLLEKHGSCEGGLSCARNRDVIHLKHAPIDSDVLEEVFLGGLRAWLASGITVTSRKNRGLPE